MGGSRFEMTHRRVEFHIVPEHVALSKAESPDKESYDDSIDTVCGKKVGKRKAGAIHGRKNPHADNDC